MTIQRIVSDPDDEPHSSGGHARLRADEARWSTLALVGIQESCELRGPNYILELRNCTCGSTLGRRTRNKEETMKFEVYRGKVGEYHWRLLGRLTADSDEGYSRREDAHRAIAALLTTIDDVVIVDA